MLLALGPLQLDPTVRTVVVGLVTEQDPACAERLAVGADAVWLTHPTPDAVAEAHGRTGLPVGVTVADLEALDELVAAGAVAVEAADVAWPEGLTIWCASAQARQAVDDGVPADRIIVEGDDPDQPGFAGVTVPGEGPAAWGAVLARVEAGARVVRTRDPRSVRRVVTVADRLLEARAAALAEATP